jgi:uncharacterized DUF497 family protein
VKFEWDENKNRTNYRKHKVWFEEAQTVWADRNAIEFYDPQHSENEDRFIRIGHSSALRLLLVIFCERVGGGIIRIVSARRATAKERKQYEERI